MSVTTDKRKVNFIIACGYCLFVIVILFNYLTKTTKRTTYREGTRRAHDTSEVYTAGNDLENQLNEQKRVNKEMREMLIDIQNAKVNNQSGGLNNTIGVMQASPKVESSVKPIFQKPVDIKTVSLPELNSDIDGKFKKNRVCPFNLERNPFASPEAVSEVSADDENISFPGHSVICNPILPYVFSSSNSDYRVISNY